MALGPESWISGPQSTVGTDKWVRMGNEEILILAVREVRLL